MHPSSFASLQHLGTEAVAMLFYIRGRYAQYLPQLSLPVMQCMAADGPHKMPWYTAAVVLLVTPLFVAAGVPRQQQPGVV